MTQKIINGLQIPSQTAHL